MKMITAEGWRLDGYRTRPVAATRRRLAPTCAGSTSAGTGRADNARL